MLELFPYLSDKSAPENWYEYDIPISVAKAELSFKLTCDFAESENKTIVNKKLIDKIFLNIFKVNICSVYLIEILKRKISQNNCLNYF